MYIISSDTLSFIPAKHYLKNTHKDRTSTKRAFISAECRGMGRLTAINTRTHRSSRPLSLYCENTLTISHKPMHSLAQRLSGATLRAHAHTLTACVCVSDTEVFMSELFGTEVALFSDPDSRPQGKVRSSRPLRSTGPACCNVECSRYATHTHKCIQTLSVCPIGPNIRH